MREILIDQNVKAYAQVKGFGKEIVTVNIMVNVSKVIDEKETRPFILKIKTTINGYEYSYSGAFTKEQINDEGNILVGQWYIVGPVDAAAIRYEGQIAFIDM